MGVEPSAVGDVKTLKPRVQTVNTGRGATIGTDRIRGRQLDRIRRRISLRDGYCCRVCGRAVVDGEVDHIIPLHMGGADQRRKSL